MIGELLYFLISVRGVKLIKEFLIICIVREESDFFFKKVFFFGKTLLIFVIFICFLRISVTDVEIRIKEKLLRGANYRIYLFRIRDFFFCFGE